jgi:hypothetical protein
MSSINPASLPPAWAHAVAEVGSRPVAGAAADAASWFDDAADSAELLRSPATAGTDTAATLSARFLDSLLQS